MIAATAPVQRSPRAKVMVVDPSGQIRHLPRPALIELIQPGDLVVANDAATIPASLSGVHLPSDRPIEVRLAGAIPASFCSSSITLETSFGLAWLITADLSSTRMFRFLLPFGMCGHPSRGRPLPSSRRPPASR